MATEKPPSDPSAIILPFGKHKGKTVAELLATDPQYADWVTAQAWVAERFAELHAAILTKGAGTDDTPEHNALQARFLQTEFCHALLETMIPERIEKARMIETGNVMDQYNRIIEVNTGRIKAYSTWKKNDHEAAQEIADAHEKIREARMNQEGARELRLFVCVKTRFEIKGVDVELTWGVRHPMSVRPFWYEMLAFELKPAMGDDYPSVLRQMRRLDAHVLVLGNYTGRGVSEPQMRAMFETSGIKVVFVSEIEDWMREPW